MTSAADFDADGLARLARAARTLSPRELVRMRQTGAAIPDSEALSESDSGRKLLAPVPFPRKVIAVGLNYRDHIAEIGAAPPEQPLIFGKFGNAVTGPYEHTVVDFELVTQLDYEVELGVVIGVEGRDLNPDDALDHVAGYMVVNDLSSRNLQFCEPQWTRSKSFDGFCPTGPCLTTRDDVPDPQHLELWTTVNGEQRQLSNTSEMVFSVAELLAFCSRATTLHPGDIVLTGTPRGVAMGDPETPWLQPGDVVECGITGLGSLRTEIVAASGTMATSTRAAS
jgi:2-keto-4-pentenoate hydratase/2-oxohepta-3-ene-1,7-dioic acid hydratase in catechol pathway